MFWARIATRILIPTLPPRLRIRLRIAVPWVRMWRGSVDNAMMFNGTKVQPRPKPCSNPEMIIGVTYSGSKKKLAEHGGFAHDDLNVMMLFSNPSMSPATVYSPVENAQVAPTILEALGLDPNKLMAVQLEGTQVLPGLDLDGGKSHD